MMDKYQKKDRGIQIIELEQSYQLCSKKEYYECLIRLAMHRKPDKTFIVFFFAAKLIRLFQFNDLDTTIFFLVFVHHILNDLTSGFFILLNSICNLRQFYRFTRCV